MPVLLSTEIGLFRANPSANVYNNLQLVDPDTPGTPGTDTLARNVATAPDLEFIGVTYQGKAGASPEFTEKFFKLDKLTGEKIYYTLPTTCTAQELEDAIRLVIEQYEVDPVVTVSKASTTFTIVHVGAGTMDDVITDAATVATTRS